MVGAAVLLAGGLWMAGPGGMRGIDAGGGSLNSSRHGTGGWGRDDGRPDRSAISKCAGETGNFHVLNETSQPLHSGDKVQVHVTVPWSSTSTSIGMTSKAS